MRTAGILIVIVCFAIGFYAAWNCGPLIWAVATGHAPNGYKGILGG